jgi:Tfp pilus assembly protein FimT
MELLVVLALIGVMLFVATPRFENSLFSDDMRTVSRWIMLQVPIIKDSARRHQKRYTLHAGFDTNALWITNESMDAAARAQAAESGYRLPQKVRLMDIQYSDMETISTGVAEISCYKQGYCDLAIIHIQNERAENHSLVIAPFISRVKLYETYVQLEG